MSRNLTDRFLNDSNISNDSTKSKSDRFKTAQKLRNQTLKQLKKNTKKKLQQEHINKPKPTKQPSKLNKQQKKYHHSVIDQLAELQDKCLNHMVLEKYSKKPDKHIIEKMKQKHEDRVGTSGTVFTDEDFENWQKDFFKKEKKVVVKQKKQTELY